MAAIASLPGSLMSLHRERADSEMIADSLYLSASSSDDDDEDYDDFEEESEQKIASKARKGRRGTVMAAPVRVDDNFQPPIYLKRSVDHRNLNNALKGNFLFQVDAEEMDILLDAFEPWEVGGGTTVITQGDVHANYFYVISDGSVDIQINEQLVAVLGKGNVFGELALLYDAPRAATVKVHPSSAAKLWRLDRQTFKKILVNVHERELKQRVNFLSQVPILAPLSELETKQLAEGMNSVEYEAGKKIIRKGEVGGTFFIVASGEVQFLNDAGAEISARGTTGSYFGEVALLKNDRRSCDVVSTQRTKCLVIDRKHFRHLVGSLELLLRRNMDVYSKFQKGQTS